MYADLNNSIVNFSNSILKHFGAETFHNSIPVIDEILKNHKKVVVCLFDGLGDNILNLHKSSAKYINKHVIHQMTATFPPTTVASTNGLLSGRFPRETGWMAWAQYFEEYNANIDMFLSRDENTGVFYADKAHNIAQSVCGYETIFELLNKVGVATYDGKPFPIYDDGAKSLFDHRKRLNKFLKENDNCFAYIYWTNPDAVIHEFGTKSWKTDVAIKGINSFVRKIVSDNPDTLFLTIADHGLVDCYTVDLCEHDDLYNMLARKISFEGRACNFFIKEEFKHDFPALFNKYYGEHFKLYTHKEVSDLNIFGEGKDHPLYDKFLGDFLAISHDDWLLFASKDYEKQKDNLKGHHGGGTKEELLINVAAYNK